MLEGERDQQMALGRPQCLWLVWVFPSKVDIAATAALGK